MRRFASNVAPTRPDAERYFAKGWLRPLVALSGKPGMHRFTWNLRYARPRAISYSYSIAAVWGENTPILPGGPYVLPGTYTLTLTANGKSQSAPLEVKEDPRVHISDAALKSSLAMSGEIASLLAPATGHFAQQQALQKQLDKRFPATAKPADAKLAALLTTLRAKPAPGTPSFMHAEGRLTGIENALESADVAPTAEQHATIARAKAELAAAEKAWGAEQAGPLAALNAALAAKGEKPLTIPPLDKAKAEAPDPGQDLP